MTKLKIKKRNCDQTKKISYDQTKNKKKEIVTKLNKKKKIVTKLKEQKIVTKLKQK